MRHQLGAMVLGLFAATQVQAAEPACGPDCLNLVLDGDSISAMTPAKAVQDRIPGVAHGTNTARGGRPVHECLTLFPTLIEPLYAPAAQRNIIIFHAGDNDIGQGRNADQTYAAFTQYVALAHRQGWRVVVSTEFHVPHFNAEREAQLEAYNTMLLRNQAGADAVVDMDADRRFLDLSYRSDPALFRDPLHPSDAGLAIMLDRLAPAIRRVAGR